METRSWVAEIRNDGEGRTLAGIAVPFNTPTEIREAGMTFTESFLPGAFDESIAKRADRIRVLAMHNRDNPDAWPIGKPTSLRSTDHGLELETEVWETQRGNDTLVMVRAGEFGGFSVGFNIPDGGDTWSPDRSQRTIHRANLIEVSVVQDPAYQDAKILALRDQVEVRDLTFDQIRDAVREAIVAKILKNPDPYSYNGIYVCDITSTWAVFEVIGAFAVVYPGYWQVDYSIDDAGAATISEPFAVEETYVPKERAIISEYALRLWEHRALPA